MRCFIDVHVPILEQMTLFDFLHEGHFVRHLRLMLYHYRQRRDLLQNKLVLRARFIYAVESSNEYDEMPSNSFC